MYLPKPDGQTLVVSYLVALLLNRELVQGMRRDKTMADKFMFISNDEKFK